MKHSITVKKVGKTFSVFVDGNLEEGGFFSRDEALKAAEYWKIHFGASES